MRVTAAATAVDSPRIVAFSTTGSVTTRPGNPSPRNHGGFRTRACTIQRLELNGWR
jgi:hypothetical protein